MASIVSFVVTSVGWCFCTACSSLLYSCCGTEKDSNIPASATSGRKRSIVVLILCIGFELAFQFGIAPYLVDMTIENFVKDAWLDGCEQYSNSQGQLTTCAGNNGNFRAAGATMLFFLLAGLAACCKSTANREAWPAKFILYVFLVIITIFIPSDPLFSDIYLNIARIGGIVYIIAQQFVIVDLAHNWNESWVDRSNAAEAEEAGSGKKWLYAILLSCFLLYAFAIALVIYMLIDFTGCTDSNTFISLTIVFCFLIHAAQLSGDEGSLLASSVVSAWACFLCYTAVSRNPNETCNPKLGERETMSIVFGVVTTILSMGWAGWSYTAEDKLTAFSKNDEDEEKPAAATPAATDSATTSGERKVTGLVTGSNAEAKTDDQYHAAASQEDDAAANPAKLSNSWRLNIVLASIACWTSMIFTHWGEISGDGKVADGTAGRISMWIVVASQWFSLTLYLWTLMAPRLFPDRDFS